MSPPSPSTSLVESLVSVVMEENGGGDAFWNCHTPAPDPVPLNAKPTQKAGQMQIVLSKDSDVPLRQQLSEQIVFLITTGQLHAGEELPSVRTLARQSKVHHNTVSEAYQELVRRGWAMRRPGSRLVVGRGPIGAPVKPHDLDDLINESIERARRMGYTLQALRLRVRERLLAEPPDHLLIVEKESGMREILRQEVEASLGWSAQGCSLEEFTREPGLAIGAQVLVANHLIETLKPHLSPNRPALGIVYSLAAEHIDLISQLDRPSIVSIVSVSESLLRTAKGFLAPAITKKHVLHEVLVTGKAALDLTNSDLALCDTLTLPLVHSRRKVHYPLISKGCLSDLAASLNQY